MHKFSHHKYFNIYETSFYAHKALHFSSEEIFMLGLISIAQTNLSGLEMGRNLLPRCSACLSGDTINGFDYWIHTLAG